MAKKYTAINTTDASREDFDIDAYIAERESKFWNSYRACHEDEFDI